MSNLINLEIHFDRHVLSLLVSANDAVKVEHAVADGASANVTAVNWMDKSIENGIYTINGRNVNFLFGKPDVPAPF